MATTFCREHYAPSGPTVFPNMSRCWVGRLWRRFRRRYDFELNGDEAERESIIRRINPIEHRGSECKKDRDRNNGNEESQTIS